MYSIIMQEFISGKGDASRAPFVIVAVVLLFMAVFLIAMNEDKLVNMTGFAVSEEQLAAQEKPVLKLLQMHTLPRIKPPRGLL